MLGAREGSGSRSRPELRIGYWPSDEAPNGYAARMRAILSGFGKVLPFHEQVGVRQLCHWLVERRAFDVVFINWLENKIVDARGRPSYSGVCKLFVQTLLFRLRARKLVFVRHNRYPHATDRAQAARMSRWIDAYEQLFDATITHSATEETGRRAYCPHPLYPVSDAPVGALPEALRLAPGYFVVFGRIERYKRIEALIALFPPNQRLVVVGATRDADYARELSALARENVVIAPGFLGEPEAQEVVRRAAGVVLSHADDDMVASGSFFYAVSIGRPVIAVETPFIRWMSELLGDALVVSARDLSQLCARIAAWVPRDEVIEPRLGFARDAFGEANVRRHLARILALVEPHERAPARRPSEAPAPVH
ncbi:MAG: hypothetical protein ABW252_19420 [Polyangiales bacterium]